MSDEYALVATSGGRPQTRWDESQVVAEPWMVEALCAQTDPEVFFPEKGGTAVPAKQVCAGCDVREQCLAYALGRGEKFGVWGGLTAHERRGLPVPERAAS